MIATAARAAGAALLAIVLASGCASSARRETSSSPLREPDLLYRVWGSEAVPRDPRISLEIKPASGCKCEVQPLVVNSTGRAFDLRLRGRPGWFHGPGKYSVRVISSEAKFSDPATCTLDGTEERLDLWLMLGPAGCDLSRLEVVRPAPAGVTLSRRWNPDAVALAEYEIANRSDRTLFIAGNEWDKVGKIERWTGSEWQHYEHVGICGTGVEWASPLSPGATVKADEGYALGRRRFERGHYRYVVSCMTSGDFDEAAGFAGRPVVTVGFRLTDEFDITFW